MNFHTDEWIQIMNGLKQEQLQEVVNRLTKMPYFSNADIAMLHSMCADGLNDAARSIKANFSDKTQPDPERIAHIRSVVTATLESLDEVAPVTVDMLISITTCLILNICLMFRDRTMFQIYYATLNQVIGTAGLVDQSLLHQGKAFHPALAGIVIEIYERDKSADTDTDTPNKA